MVKKIIGMFVLLSLSFSQINFAATNDSLFLNDVYYNASILDKAGEKYISSDLLDKLGIVYKTNKNDMLLSNEQLKIKMVLGKKELLDLGKNKTVKMKSVGCYFDQKTQETLRLNAEADKLKDKVKFVNNEKIFTLFAFMNYTGYDDENYATFSEVRQKVREELKSMNFTISDPNYFRNRKVAVYKYVNEIASINGAPNFELRGKIETRELQDLNAALKEFYEKANIGELYKKYDPDYQKVINQYQSSLVHIVRTNELLKIKPEDVKSLEIGINLLDANERGTGPLKHVDTKSDLMIIGPAGYVNDVIVIHEYCHGIINPIINKNLSIVSQMKNQEISNQLDRSYKSWQAVTTESLVRAISMGIVYGKDTKYLNVDVARGFSVTKFAADKLFSAYESYSGTLEEFIVEEILKKY